MSHTETSPREYLVRSDTELSAAIEKIKQEAGDSLTILGHHYQSDAIVELSDFVGDSFKLCRDAADATAKHIVFCGVQFMAESARVLAREDQVVLHPERSAGCPMADMADVEQVQRAWDAVSKAQPDKTIVPVTYMNSNVDLKAFCGSHGGIVCTSSNASRVFDWAYERGETILFFPDEHLGRNTAHAKGMAPELIARWDASVPNEENDLAAIAGSKVVVWKGHCHVHTRFKPEDVKRARTEHPDAHIIVHPECPREVTALCDSNGSTEAIVRRVLEAQPGETIIIGTELNLVNRLADKRTDVQVLPLAPSICHNMAKITLANLLWTMENRDSVGVVRIEEGIVRDARTALERMLTVV